MIRRVVSNSQLKLINKNFIINSLNYCTATKLNNKNINNNNNIKNELISTNSKRHDNKYAIRVIAPPNFIAERISSIVNKIFSSLKNGSVKDCLNQVDILKSIKVEKYQPMYTVFQKLLEFTIEINKNNQEKRDKQLKAIIEHLIEKYSDSDLIQIYCYNLVTEKQILIRFIEEGIVKKFDSDKLNVFSYDVIKNILYFNRIDLAIKVFRDRFTLYNVGNSMAIVITFFDFHLKRRENDLAEVWDNKKTTLYHNDAKVLEHFADKSTRFNYGFIDNPRDHRHFFQKIHYFCHGELCSNLPVQLSINNFPKDPVYKMIATNQIELNNGINNLDFDKIENALLNFFIPNNIIPYKNTFMKAISILKKSEGHQAIRLVKNLPEYITSMMTYRDVQKQLSLDFRFDDIEKFTQLPDIPLMNKVFQVLCNQDQNLKYPIEYFKALSKISSFHFTLATFELFCTFIIKNFKQLLEFYNPLEMEEIIKIIGNHKESHNLLIDTINYDNLILKLHLNKYQRIVTKIKNETDKEKARDHFIKEIDRLYNDIKVKNRTTIELGCEFYRLKNEPLSDINQIYRDAVQHGLLREYTEIYTMDLINNKQFDQLELNFKNDPLLINDLSQKVLLEYFKLISDKPQIIMKRFLEKASQIQHYIPEFIDYVNNINLNSNKPNQNVSILIQSIKDNKMDDLAQNNDSVVLNQNKIKILDRILEILKTGNYLAHSPLFK